MKRNVLIIVGTLLLTAIVSATSIALYAHFTTPRSYWNETAERLLRPPTQPSTDVPDSMRAQTNSLLSLTQALEIAAHQVKGEVLKVELEREHGRSIYEIKVLAENGRVREVSIDARSGEIIEVEED